MFEETYAFNTTFAWVLCDFYQIAIDFSMAKAKYVCVDVDKEFK